jgi:nucleoside-diphosphate-sugar epimerase
MKNILIIGAKGSIGNYIYNKFKEEKYNVYGTTSKNNSDTYIYIENVCLEAIDLIRK